MNEIRAQHGPETVKYLCLSNFEFYIIIKINHFFQLNVENRLPLRIYFHRKKCTLFFLNN
jgi:hypothetical protein